MSVAWLQTMFHLFHARRDLIDVHDYRYGTGSEGTLQEARMRHRVVVRSLQSLGGECRDGGVRSIERREMALIWRMWFS